MREELLLNHMPVVPHRLLPEESSQFRHLTTLATTPCFLPLASASLFVGLGNAVGGSYLTLFVIDKAHLSPLALGVFLTVYSLSGMIISTSFGHWFDRAPSPIPLLLALVMTISGYALLSVTTNLYLLLLIAGLPLGTSLAVFPQLFALAQGHLDRVGAETAERGTAMMRATWSIAWAVGPALGALMISLFDFQGVFLTAAMCVVTATVIVAVARVDALRPAKTPRNEEKALSGRVGSWQVVRDVIARAIFTSVKDLAGKPRRYIDAYSASAKPIQWKYSNPSRRIRSSVVSATCG